MKIVRLRLIFLLVLLLPVVGGIAAPPSPPPPSPGGGPPPPPGLPIDSGLAVLMLAALLYGAFEMYRYNIKKTR